MQNSSHHLDTYSLLVSPKKISMDKKKTAEQQAVTPQEINETKPCSPHPIKNAYQSLWLRLPRHHNENSLLSSSHEKNNLIKEKIDEIIHSNTNEEIINKFLELCKIAKTERNAAWGALAKIANKLGINNTLQYSPRTKTASHLINVFKYNNEVCQVLQIETADIEEREKALKKIIEEALDDNDISSPISSPK